MRSEFRLIPPSLTLSTKLLILFILLILLPLITQGIVTYFDFSSTIERRTKIYAIQIVNQINKSLDKTFMEEKQSLSLLTIYNGEMKQILQNHSQANNKDSIPSTLEKSTMFRYMAASSPYRSEIRGIQIITTNGYLFTDMDPYLIKSFYFDDNETWVPRVRNAAGLWVAIPQHYPKYLSETKPMPYISLARMIIDPGSMQSLGIIKVDFRLEVFSQIAANYKFGEIGSLLILNKDNELFYEQNIEGIKTDFKEINSVLQLHNESASFEAEINGKKHLVIIDQSDNTGLKVVSLIPEHLLLKETLPIKRVSILIGSLCLIVGIILALFFSYRLSRPLVELRNKMKLVQLGNFRQSIDVHTQDEFGQLARGFNRMSAEIERLIEEVLLIGIKEKEAEISALLSQMNPHFMYNTLESINMKAIQNQNYDVSDMVSALGNLLRYTINTSSKYVPLALELSSIESYIQIQQIRYGERLKVFIQVENQLRSLLIPKLLFQPLVENAIYHGIEDMNRGGEIWIRVDTFENNLLLTVRDNGKGLTEDEIKWLYTSLKQPINASSKGSGVALRNIDQRVKLMYGEEFGLHIDGIPGEGASFTITLPIEPRRDYNAQNPNY
ncbi:cache domain-containing sensor histidine kinase [Paenibacillus sp. FSL H8-0034]|uniref:cache domain-containing sensor histidine kinase n=1 Tax=Paenibacillus sp. FSL H8-0034 TaxID=2954671 RepID=UPI0030FA0E95